ncbi:hypothetical protein P3342_009045 [Pyrenophora teres f. teres]|nr:hypothetical protein P3342_009045 [Pyrenophora teres f. teres]
MGRMRARYISFRQKFAFHIKREPLLRKEYRFPTPDTQACDPTEIITKTSTIHELEEEETAVSRLCSDCRDIDFEELFSRGRHVEKGGEFVTCYIRDDIWKECASCRLFHTVTSNAHPVSHIQLLDATKEIFLNRRLKFISPTFVLVGSLSIDGEAPYQPCDYWCQDYGFIFAKARVDGNVGQNGVADATRVDLSQVNFKLLNKWLLQCDSHHEDACEAKANLEFSTPLSCIECHTRSIVHIKEEDEYVALSYVWGTTCSSISQETRGHGESLPLDGVTQVIEDAIAVVVALGKRYLWVDQYCVNQLDMNTKASQIREMDRVYAGAYVTIVACAGVDSDYGLPGISRERNPRPFATSPQLELLTSSPALSVAIRDTKWRTRGWTYQEAVLSRRCLLFTDQQVYFACTNMSCCETDTDAGATSYHASHKSPMDLSKRLFHCEHQSTADTDDLFAQIGEYSGRILSHEEDALNAFRGLLNRSRFYTYYGLPVVSINNQPELPAKSGDMNLGFARGLLWKGKYKTKLIRRQDFPSWSWVGWSGIVGYAESLTKGRGVKNTNDIQIWIEDEDGKLVAFHQLAMSVERTRMIAEKSSFLVVEAPVTRLRFKLIDKELLSFNTFDVFPEHTTRRIGYAEIFEYSNTENEDDEDILSRINYLTANIRRMKGEEYD